MMDQDNHTTTTNNRIGRLGLAKGKFSAPDDFDIDNDEVIEMMSSSGLEPSPFKVHNSGERAHRLRKGGR